MSIQTCYDQSRHFVALLKAELEQEKMIQEVRVSSPPYAQQAANSVSAMKRISHLEAAVAAALTAHGALVAARS